MPPAWLSELTKSAAWRRVPWGRALQAAIWLFRQGRDRLENLSQKERQELAEIVRKSRARPSNLSTRERERLRELVRKALTGRRRHA